MLISCYWAIPKRSTPKVSTLAGSDDYLECDMFLRGTFSGLDLHFTLWVWCDWQWAEFFGCLHSCSKKILKSQHGQIEVRAQVGVALNAKPQALTWWIMCLWQFSHLSWIFFQHKKKQTGDKAKARYLELCVLSSNQPDVTTRQTYRKFYISPHIQIFKFNSLHWSSRATEF